MANQTRKLYWDSNVFISYFSKTTGRVETIESLLDEVRDSQGEIKIFTSVLSRAEVAFVEYELVKDKPLLPDTEKVIDDFWADDSVIELIEVHEQIVKMSRTIMRNAKAGGYKVPKPPDAIHLATAKWIEAAELHTYDVNHFEKCGKEIGVVVCEPYTARPRFPGM